MLSSQVPKIRIQQCNNAEVRHDGEFVLYWMLACRRTNYNFSLQRAVEWAVLLNKPLVIFEPLRVGYTWASDRIHKFVIDGMADNATRIAAANLPGVVYIPYIEPCSHAGKPLLTALVNRASVVVTDNFPAFFLPRLVSLAAMKMNVKSESVDSNGLFPMQATDRAFTTAFSFRAFLQKALPARLEQFPLENPLQGLNLPPLKSLPNEIIHRWSIFTAKQLIYDTAKLASLPIDHSVTALKQQGGTSTAQQQLKHFLEQLLPKYVSHGNEPDDNIRSGLSPYLHFGHISPHEMFRELMSREGWSLQSLGKKTNGKREGWWGASPEAEAWIDEFVTWREIGYNMATHSANYEQYESLPSWAQATLQKHANDRREYVYSLETFTSATTHDSLWNAAQNQLVREGRIHNYLRMLWGKKILEWTEHPREALAIMIELNNKYALDGRNPNSYSGIFWVLGRYDRAWGPERPIFGTVRYMSSESTRKKLRVREYLRTYA